MKKAAKLARREAKQQKSLAKSRDASPSPTLPQTPPPAEAPTVTETSSIPASNAPKEQPIVDDVVPPEPAPPPELEPEPKVAPPPAASRPENSPPVNGSAKPTPSVVAPTVPLHDVVLPQKAEPPAKPDAADPEEAQKRQNVVTRTVWTLIMIFGFISLLLMGHGYMILLVMLCQTLVYREVTALFSLKASDIKASASEDIKDPWSKTLNWYFFAVTNYFLYGESIIYYFKHVVFADAQLLPFATNHRMISFMLYTIGFMGFVMSLKKGYLKQQFGLFCWVHMTLLFIVVSSHFIMNNILEGLIWFFVPASLVICNDVFAYIWGKTIGRTPLISLSPKKTVEGFVGAFWTTLLFSLLWGSFFMRFKYMICPVHDLGVSAWSNVTCTPNPVFVWKEWQIWTPVTSILSACLGISITSIPYTLYHFHLMFMSIFASLVAPFGGFFASGFKRAFNIKDFGHSIPGHGGMTDRMDCQFLMGVFIYVYYSSLIREHHVTVGSVLQTIVSGLTVDEQLELLADMKRYLEGQSIRVPC
ncbi:phosphatidate cytidylyltransferase [Armillaria novae-zelandiae]|uniref:Phosphatidate cytidylyltransferase n=1 Tax=Armillaria novae-zelandiae TaxID=153914 RepID=A0AA39N9F6_9AGAR|nr:phosphatidate cytidylyltransferase [Armillaria novae-zelandiae]KAK0461456.1 phosphatidate cytidylyltransferase [Armillaria novae-zelandiae]